MKLKYPRICSKYAIYFFSKRANITYEELATRLKPHGVTENAASIANKLARGTFAAAFFLACLAALELDGVRLEDI